MYYMKTVQLTKRQETGMEVAELKMLRFTLGLTRLDKNKNKFIRGKCMYAASARRLEMRGWGGEGMSRGGAMGMRG